jgi:DNA-binding MarR family transcriptional regulator
MAGKNGVRSVEEDVRDLLRLFPRVVRSLRRCSPPEPLRQAFEAGTLGPRHIPVLFSLALEGPATVSELAGRIALAPATTSLLVNELSRAQLVDRREDDNDRRRTIVSLPDELRPLMEVRAQEHAEPLRRTLERLQPEARAHFIAGCRILADEARRTGGESEEP